MRKIQEHPTAPDELSLAQGAEPTVWGLPSDEGQVGQHPGVVPMTVDYSRGLLVHADDDANSAALINAKVVAARVDVPHSYQAPHESTHRRYEPPRTFPINQAAAGYTLIAPANQGLHYIKVIAAIITLDAAGTLKFVQGGDGLGTGISATAGGGDLSGAFNLGGGSAPPLQLTPSGTENPWFFTSPDQPLGIFTVTGKAQGFVTVVYSPYDY